MKKLARLFLGIFVAGIVLSGCQEAKEALDVKFNANYEAEFDVTIPGSKGVKAGINGAFSITETIDPNSNTDYVKYIDNIKEIDISEVTGEVLSISKNVILETTTISVYNENYDATWQFTNKPITVGTILTLDNSAGQWDAMSNIMLGKKVFTVSLVGQTDEDDVDFVVLFTLKSEVIANPL